MISNTSKLVCKQKSYFIDKESDYLFFPSIIIDVKNKWLKEKHNNQLYSCFYLFFSLFYCRVSFGSSKGSMVETLIFETPTPVSEYPERHIGGMSHHLHHHPTQEVPVHQNENQLHHQQNNGQSVTVFSDGSTDLDDSGIELQHEE